MKDKHIVDHTDGTYEVPPNKTYELWNVDTNRLMGTLELGNDPEFAHKARVNIKLKSGYVTDSHGKAYNAFEVLVCGIDKRNEQGEIVRRYWALETNLPFHIAKHLDGFTPKIERPSLAQMFFLKRHEGQIKVKK